MAYKRPAIKKKECGQYMLPLRDALNVLNGKWKIIILLALSVKEYRFKELQNEIHGIAGKMLSKELKELVQNDLVKRTVHDTMPISIVYSITAYGRSLENVIEELRKWGIKHRNRMIK
ncbi:MAG: helix-turn-helix transcriptional regulator [Flavipsychrobacter sp.]|nr:helix-turn-helix transcriptional regulator [Flavipsychrobacter sp.]